MIDGKRKDAKRCRKDGSWIPNVSRVERSIVDQKANQGGTTQSDINIGVIQRIIAFIQASDQRMQCWVAWKVLSQCN